MSRNLLFRLAAFASFGSAILAITALVGFIVVVGSGTISEGARSASFYVPAGAALGAVILLAVGLIGLFLYQETDLGPMGIVGFLVALAGTILAAGGQWTYVFVVPYLAEPAPQLVNESSGVLLAGFVLSYTILALGWVLFGVATLKANLFPRGAVFAMIAGGAISFLPLPSRTLVLSVAVAYLGNQLRSDSGRAVIHPMEQ